VLHLSHSPWLDHPSNIQWPVQNLPAPHYTTCSSLLSLPPSLPGPDISLITPFVP
jgi:hypothetical protein